MKLAIMQPYFFPYIGYFQLIYAVDKIIFYDDVNYIKGGWINRNKILVNKKEYLFTIPIKNPSSYKLINQTEVCLEKYQIWKKKFLNTLRLSYKKAPYFDEIFSLVENTVNVDNLSIISEIAIHSVINVFEYLGIKIKYELSSEYYANNKELKKSSRLIDICRINKAETYINPIGGIKLYDKNEFREYGIELKFLKTKDIIYKQFDNEFISNLSIIDVMMFNSKDRLIEILNDYELI